MIEGHVYLVVSRERHLVLNSETLPGQWQHRGASNSVMAQRPEHTSFGFSWKWKTNCCTLELSKLCVLWRSNSFSSPHSTRLDIWQNRILKQWINITFLDQWSMYKTKNIGIKYTSSKIFFDWCWINKIKSFDGSFLENGSSLFKLSMINVKPWNPSIAKF